MGTTIKAINEALKGKVICHFDGFNANRKQYTVDRVKRGFANNLKVEGHTNKGAIELDFTSEILQALIDNGSHSIRGEVDGCRFLICWTINR